MADERTDAETDDLVETESTEVDEVVDGEEIVDAEITEVEVEADDDLGADGSDAEDTDADAPAAAAPKVVRRKVVSKRVTPKGGGPARSSGPATKATIAAAEARASSKKRKDDDDEITFNDRYVSPNANAQLPSPWWVPTLMFGLILIGALVIILNYTEVFGAAKNAMLLVGLGFILGGIITATQYR